MAGPADDKHPTSGYDDTTPSNSSPVRISCQRRRRPTPTITAVRVARIETVAMTPVEETEAIEALAVLIARYWREHPEQPSA